MAYEFSILTRESAANLAHIHNRMPVILHHSKYDEWLSPTGSPETILKNGVVTECWQREVVTSAPPPAKLA